MVARGAYDFETYDWTKPLAVGLRWGDSDWLYLRNATSPEVVTRFALFAFFEVASKGGPSEWWAHNGGNFDALAIMAQAARDGFSLNIATAMGGRVVRMEISDGKRKVVLKDSYAVVPSSLKTACKDFELTVSKLFDETDYSADMRQCPPKRLEAGCRADCEAVLELLNNVAGRFGKWGGALKTTFSSSALSVIKGQVALPVIPPEANLIADQAFYGGRVEVFEHAPPWTLREYDVTSSYPWSMTQVLPHEYVGDVAPNLTDEGVSKATVSVNAAIPALPYRDRKRGLYFPNGVWTGWFCNNLLRYVSQNNLAHVTLRETHAYTAWQPFKGYVEKLFQVKATTHGAERNFVKLLLNGSYGKFGERPDKEKLVLHASEREAIEALVRAEVSGNPNTVLGDDCRFQLVPTFRWPRHTHYALAGYITAYSQILLHRHLMNANNLCYCDTDSIHASPSPGLEAAVNADLGGLKVEVQNMTANYFAPKIYELFNLDTKEAFVASKGFHVSPADFRRIINGELLARETIMKAKTQARTGNTFTRLEGTKAPKRGWSGRSMKRKPLSNGATKPWEVEELERGRHLEAVSPKGQTASAAYRARKAKAKR